MIKRFLNEILHKPEGKELEDMKRFGLNFGVFLLILVCLLIVPSFFYARMFNVYTEQISIDLIDFEEDVRDGEFVFVGSSHTQHAVISGDGLFNMGIAGMNFCNVRDYLPILVDLGAVLLIEVDLHHFTIPLNDEKYYNPFITELFFERSGEDGIGVVNVDWVGEGEVLLGIKNRSVVLRAIHVGFSNSTDVYDGKVIEHHHSDYAVILEENLNYFLDLRDFLEESNVSYFFVMYPLHDNYLGIYSDETRSLYNGILVDEKLVNFTELVNDNKFFINVDHLNNDGAFFVTSELKKVLEVD